MPDEADAPKASGAGAGHSLRITLLWARRLLEGDEALAAGRRARAASIPLG